MSGINGIDVKKAKNFFILVNFVGRYLFDDFAKYAFVHKHTLLLFAMGWQSILFVLCIILDCFYF